MGRQGGCCVVVVDVSFFLQFYSEPRFVVDVVLCRGGGSLRSLLVIQVAGTILPSPLEQVLVLAASGPHLNFPCSHHRQRVRELADLGVPRVPTQGGRGGLVVGLGLVNESVNVQPAA